MRGCAELAGLYVVTPVAKEAWVVAAPRVLGVPILLAALVVLAVNAAFSAGALTLLPRSGLVARVAPKVAPLRERLLARRGARGGLAFALALVVALPIHSGGALVGTLAGVEAGLSKPRAFVAVMGGVLLRLAAVVAVVLVAA